MKMKKWESISALDSEHKVFIRKNLQSVIGKLIDGEKIKCNLSDLIDISAHSKALAGYGLSVDVSIPKLICGDTQFLYLEISLDYGQEVDQYLLDYILSVLSPIMDCAFEDFRIAIEGDEVKLSLKLGCVGPRYDSDSAADISATLVEVLNSLFNDELVSEAWLKLAA